MFYVINKTVKAFKNDTRNAFVVYIFSRLVIVINDNDKDIGRRRVV